MSSGTAQGQISSSSQQQQQQQQSLLRPEQIRGLLNLTPEQRGKYEHGIRQLWDTIQSNSPDTPDHQTASAKLHQISNKIREDFRKWKAQNQGNTNQMPQQNTKPASQGQQGPQGQTAQASGLQAQQRQAQAPPSQGQPQIPAAFLQKAQQLSIILPPALVQGTPEADGYITEARNRYGQNSYQRVWGMDRLKQINSMIEQRKAQGQDIPAELLVQKATTEQSVTKATRYLEDFRQKQQHYQAQRLQPQNGEHQGGNGNGSSGDPASAQQGHVQHQAQENRQGLQPPVAGVHTLNSALESARSQASATERTSASPSMAGQTQAGQSHSSQAPPNPTLQASAAAHIQQQYQQQQQHQQQQQQQSTPSFNLNRPPPSRQQSQQQQPPFQMPAHQRSQHVTPSQPGAPQGPPAPLSHSAAVSAAANAYSDQRTTPQSTIGQHPQIGKGDQSSQANRFQIPKQLNVSTPHPVHIGASRPTMGGPNNGAPGMMGQPVIPKLPQFILEGDGDRVLSKKKLDELVRQVTGGVEGAAGESLAPEVEEAMFLLADEFVDNVVTQACRMAKARESNSLELRDIQHVLERTYNIRVPGYASDDIRTVRKLQPAAGWTQKLNAVQAAKVMGGKTE